MKQNVRVNLQISDINETFLIYKSKKKNMLVMLVTSVFQVFYDVNAS